MRGGRGIEGRGLDGFPPRPRALTAETVDGCGRRSPAGTCAVQCRVWIRRQAAHGYAPFGCRTAGSGKHGGRAFMEPVSAMARIAGESGAGLAGIRGEANRTAGHPRSSGLPRFRTPIVDVIGKFFGLFGNGIPINSPMGAGESSSRRIAGWGRGVAQQDRGNALLLRRLRARCICVLDPARACGAERLSASTRRIQVFPSPMHAPADPRIVRDSPCRIAPGSPLSGAGG